MTSLRLRLALLHGGVVFGGGFALLALILAGMFSGGQSGSGAAHTNLALVLRFAFVGLLILGGSSVVLGWSIAGRALRPLTAMTRSVRDMSADDLARGVPVPAAYREFTELADTLDLLLRRLHESFEAQRQFVANASHELRTPLTVQRTLLELAPDDPAAQRELLELNRQQEALISSLLALASGYAGGSSVPFDLAAVTEKVVAGVDRRGVSVLGTFAETMVAGDPSLTGSLVTNLVDNAVQHNVPGGQVWVTVKAAQLTVSNTGPIVPPDEIDRLLRPFERLGAGRTDQTDGHGLGLAIVAAGAQAQSASLSVVARPQGGLEITVGFQQPNASL